MLSCSHYLQRVRHYEKYKLHKVINGNLPSHAFDLIVVANSLDSLFVRVDSPWSDVFRRSWYSYSGKVYRLTPQIVFGERRVVFDAEIKDGKYHGKFIAYNFSKQKIRFEGNFINGVKHGKFTYYHLNGNISEIKYFCYGHENGIWKTFNEEGNLIKSVNYGTNEKCAEVNN